MDLQLGGEEKEDKDPLPDLEDSKEKIEKNEVAEEMDEEDREKLARYFQQSLNIAMGAGRKESTLRESDEGDDKVIQAILLVGAISAISPIITLLQLQGII